MTQKKRGSSQWVFALMGLVLLAVSACNSRPSTTKTEDEKPPGAATPQKTANPDIDLNCVTSRLQNPPEAFHYSYKWNGDRFVDQEVDVTPQTIDGFVKSNNSGSDLTNAIHAVRSDADGWRMAVGTLNFGIAGLASGFALVRHGNPTIREGTESVNGYDTIKYSIDTDRGDDAEKALFRITVGSGGFEKGTVWATPQGCPVKISLDDKIVNNDGSVTKDHYEEAMIQK
jgi:hypothetical protein